MATYPLPKFHYQVQWGGSRLGFTEVTGLTVENELIEYREGNSPLLVKQSITATEEMLPPHLFIRIHRSFIVSVNKITAFTSNDVEILKMEIPIGRMYKPQLQKLSNLPHLRK